MAYYPNQLPGDVAPARRPGGVTAKPPRVWKGVATLAVMFLLVGGVTGAGALESNSLHSIPISRSAAAAPIANVAAPASSGANAPAPATPASPSHPPPA